MRKYHIVSIRNDNKAVTHLTRHPMSHKECMIMKSKLTEYKFRTIRIVEADMHTNKLPVRDDVTECTYHRKPTKSEIRFGNGAIHYRTFTIEECCHKGTRIKKQWFVAKDDKLRYYA